MPTDNATVAAPAFTLVKPSEPAAVDNTPAGDSYDDSAARPPVETAPETVDTKPAEKKPGDAPAADKLVSQLAKASANERKEKARAADLETKLSAATKEIETLKAGSSRVKELEDEISGMLAHPSRYFKRFKPKKETTRLSEILEGFSADEIQEDPRLKEVLDWKTAKEKEEAEAKTAREEAEKTGAAENVKQVNARVVSSWIEKIKTANATATEGEVPRWGAIEGNSEIVEAARKACYDFAVAEKIQVTDEIALDLMQQALDQAEEAERKRIADELADRETRAQKLGLRRLPSDNKGATSFSSSNTESSQARKPTVSQNTRGSLPPPSGEKGKFVHGFTNRG
jgi:hypothetical protein